jgi:RimJ/RimL family protein N-acetyltransferase
LLRGERAVLRAPSREDIEQQHTHMAGDYELHAIVDGGAWRPEGLEAALARYDRRLGEPVDTGSAWFTVARRDDPELAWVGRAGLWNIGEHARTAHLGITLSSTARGQGLGTDAVRLLCDYAFRVRDLHRLSLETLVSNEPMLRAARAAGFVEEGRLREAAYVLGDRVDEIQLGLLRSEWLSGSDPARSE